MFVMRLEVFIINRMISVGSRDINAFEINLDINFVHRNKDQVKRKVI